MKINLFNNSLWLCLSAALCSTPSASGSGYRANTQEQSLNPRDNPGKNKLTDDESSSAKRKHAPVYEDISEESDSEEYEGKLVIDERSDSERNERRFTNFSIEKILEMTTDIDQSPILENSFSACEVQNIAPGTTTGNAAPLPSNAPLNSFVVAKNIPYNGICQYFLELTTRLIFFRHRLAIFNSCFWKSFDLVPNNNNIFFYYGNIDTDITSQPLVSLIDKLLEFNTINNNHIIFDFLIKEEDKAQALKLSIKRSIKELKEELSGTGIIPSKRCQLELSLQQKERELDEFEQKESQMLKQVSFKSIVHQIDNLCNPVPSRHRIDFPIALISIFGSINKIVTFYNQNLRETLHNHLTGLDLSSIGHNQKFIKYSKFKSHPNYLAYLMVDLYFNHFVVGEGGKVGCFLNHFAEHNLVYALSILSFISVNNPIVSKKTLENNKGNTFKKMMEICRQTFLLNQDKSKLKPIFDAFYKDINSFNSKIVGKTIDSILYEDLVKLEGQLRKFIPMLYHLALHSLNKAVLEEKGN